MNLIMAFCLVCAVIALAFGLARLIKLFFDRREADAARVIREAALLHQLRCEFPKASVMLSRGWVEVGPDGTERDADHYRRAELAATKRGDLWLAAHYAELAEVSRA